MSSAPWAKSLDSLAEAATELVWRQWRAIGAGASSSRGITALVDPEALILASLALSSHEPRLQMIMPDWLIDGARFISTQRLKNLAPGFGLEIRKPLASLARIVVTRAKDGRWRALGGAGEAPPWEQEGKRRSGGVVLTSGPALMLRTRAAFGVGIKSDLIAFLLGQELRTTVSGAAESLGCSVPTAFRALQDLAAAGLVRTEDVTAATEYALDGSAWVPILGSESGNALWRWWAELLAYILDVSRITRSYKDRKVSSFALGVTLREVAERHARGLTRARGLARFPALPDSADPEAWFDHYGALRKYFAERA